MDDVRTRASHGRRAALAAGLLAVLCAVGMAGCQSQGSATGIRDGDPTLYAEEVQPIVRGHCAFLGCHGREGMPLTLYAVDYLRLRDPERLHGGERTVLHEQALTDFEIEHNRRALASRAGPADPTGERVLRRLIPASQGGVRHAGIVVFERESDPGLAAIRRFFATVRDE